MAATAAHTAWISLGSNLGDRAAQLAFATGELAKRAETLLLRVSRVYETLPVGPPQGRYLNAVARLRTSLEPEPLLRELQAIEARAGRTRSAESVRFGPRVLDLDLLLYDDLCLSSPDLTLPHPRLHERAFVLVPLCELAPDLVHPRLGRTMRDLLARVGAAGVDPWPAALPEPR